ncbi:hypothetical protein [Providencia alcalifaciens]|nr:hypothetical protein [Providencia alcalifaciens]
MDNSADKAGYKVQFLNKKEKKHQENDNKKQFEYNFQKTDK